MSSQNFTSVESQRLFCVKPSSFSSKCMEKIPVVRYESDTMVMDRTLGCSIVTFIQNILYLKRTSDDQVMTYDIYYSSCPVQISI